MHDLYVSDIVRLCDGKVICGSADTILGNFCTDSRKVEAGDVYVGLRGENVDGSDFYQQATYRGARVCILGKEVEGDFADCTVVVVPDTVKCLQELARYKREMYDIPVVAVTGSVGKTSTKDIIYSVMARKYRTHRTIGNYNNHIGVPLTILGLKDEEALVVEMGMNHFGEIALLSEIAKPTMAVITNVGTAHIGNLGSRENILKAKLEILEGMIGEVVVLNHDDDMLVRVEDELRKDYHVCTISVRDELSTYQAIALEEQVFSSKFDVRDGATGIMVNVGGEAYVYNALFAYAVGKNYGIEDEEIRKGIYEFKLSASRLEKKVMKSGATMIDDTYNANYDSMKSSIELLGHVKEKRKIAILGDMLELGDYTEELHTKLGDVVVENGIDVLITVGEYSLFIEKRAMELGMSKSDIYHFEHEQDSHEFLSDFLEKDDIVLVKGSHGVHLIGIVEAMMNFSSV